MNKKETVYSVIAMIILMVFIFIATYAYFAGIIQNDNIVNFNTTTPEALASFTAYSTNPLALNISLDDLSNTSTNAVKTDTGDIIVQLSSPSSSKTVYCTYDIEFVWDSTDQYVTPSMTLEGDYLYEISLSGSQSIVGDTSGHEYANINFSETDLSTFSWNGSSGVAGRKAIIVNDATIYSRSATDTTATWTFTLNFYSLPVKQESVLGKNLAAHLTASNIIC